LLSDRNEADVEFIELLDELSEVGQRTGKSVTFLTPMQTARKIFVFIDQKTGTLIC